MVVYEQPVLAMVCPVRWEEALVKDRRLVEESPGQHCFPGILVRTGVWGRPDMRDEAPGGG